MNQGTRWALLMQKNHRRKSHAWAPLKGIKEKLDMDLQTTVLGCEFLLSQTVNLRAIPRESQMSAGSNSLRRLPQVHD
jgi:hypothetical protein